MKIKGFLVLGSCLLTLAGCQGTKDKPVNKLALLNCTELNEFHQSTTNDLDAAVKDRETNNAVNIVVGVMGMLSGSGGFYTNSSSKEERNLKLELASLESIAQEKGCEITTLAAADVSDKTTQ